MPDQSGLEVLTALLSVLDGVVLPTETDDEETLPPDIPCQVPHCTRSGIFRCSLGWRYCADHVGRHGAWGNPHTFSLDLMVRRKEIDSARATVIDRIQHYSELPDAR